MAQELALQNVIINYPNLFDAKQINGTGDPKFSATLILPVDFDWGPVQQSVNEAIAAKWGANPPAGIKMPWTDAGPDGFPNQFLCKAYSGVDRPPQVADQLVQPVMDRGLIFSGCLVNAYVRFYGYPNNGGGIAVGLNGIMLVDNVNVTRLDNRKDLKEVFQPIAGAPAATAVGPGATTPVATTPVNTGAPAPATGAPVNTGAPASTPPNQPWNQ